MMREDCLQFRLLPGDKFGHKVAEAAKNWAVLDAVKTVTGPLEYIDAHIDESCHSQPSGLHAAAANSCLQIWVCPLQENRSDRARSGRCISVFPHRDPVWDCLFVVQALFTPVHHQRLIGVDLADYLALGLGQHAGTAFICDASADQLPAWQIEAVRGAGRVIYSVVVPKRATAQFSCPQLENHLAQIRDAADPDAMIMAADAEEGIGMTDVSKYLLLVLDGMG